ncbi:hypothetical protein HETIRDRAFT_448552 [Heterobasidion irregulare TC 32-1]|uniref:Uncharacterized protein n=1 Tax=Heterobasidion irregulare (strain TC 32-1) TaxID=747525 RepID=W4KHY7_HETIT|nr:uncharacterized protein HETIRDRAFT_448552 [Heterobasidion irregulare TC 32-1]ETW85457.1 hypothetical protein HETIRDRAFT_448552 [Heterobasidion irregulare TC 32-1]
MRAHHHVAPVGMHCTSSLPAISTSIFILFLLPGRQCNTTSCESGSFVETATLRSVCGLQDEHRALLDLDSGGALVGACPNLYLVQLSSYTAVFWASRGDAPSLSRRVTNPPASSGGGHPGGMDLRPTSQTARSPALARGTGIYALRTTATRPRTFRRDRGLHTRGSLRFCACITYIRFVLRRRAMFAPLLRPLHVLSPSTLCRAALSYPRWCFSASSLPTCLPTPPPTPPLHEPAIPKSAPSQWAVSIPLRLLHHIVRLPRTLHRLYAALPSPRPSPLYLVALALTLLALLALLTLLLLLLALLLALTLAILALLALLLPPATLRALAARLWTLAPSPSSLSLSPSLRTGLGLGLKFGIRPALDAGLALGKTAALHALPGVFARAARTPAAHVLVHAPPTPPPTRVLVHVHAPAPASAQAAGTGTGTGAELTQALLGVGPPPPRARELRRSRSWFK